MHQHVCMHTQAAMSMCEGNLLSAHLIGDAIALAAAAAQAPWLCGDMCSGLGQLCCSSWVILQVVLSPFPICTVPVSQGPRRR